MPLHRQLSGYSEPKPKQLQAYELAQREIGVKEIPGESDNPTIVQYFADVGHDWVKDDETAWCAAFVGSMLKRAGLPHTGKLSARSYKDWGADVFSNWVDFDELREGDIVVFWRGSPNGWQGHVGFYVGHTAKSIKVLGGNQDNSVNIRYYRKNRLLGARRFPEPTVNTIPKLPSKGNWFTRLIAAIFKRKK